MSARRLSKPRGTRKAPKKALLSLASLTIRRVEDFSGKPLSPLERDTICTRDVALALDFLERIQYRRVEEEKKAWIDAEAVTDQLHTLRRLMLADPRGMEIPAIEMMSEILEYLAIRAALGAESDTTRARRYMVTVDAPALAVAPKRKAVAA